MKTPTLPSLENERNALPSWVVNPKCRRSEGRAHRVVWDSIIIQVARLAVGCSVLSEQRVFPFDRWDGPEYLDLSGGRSAQGERGNAAVQ